MNALDTLSEVCNTKLVNANLQWCLVSKEKLPFTISGSPCRPNVDEDFISLSEMPLNILENYAGLGISVKASKICAIDVDHCFTTAFDINSADERAKYFLQQFKEIAYVEFSFSGTGLRILFKTDNIENYSQKYYIKNQLNHIEYYQPSGNARYVTITGKTISDKDIDYVDILIVKNFLDMFMLKSVKKKNVKISEKEETRTLQELLIEAKRLYLKNSRFQNIWFKQAPGSGKNESELDYQMIAMIYENITTDREMVRQIFEASDYYKSKDSHHIYKWTYNNYRYFNYQFDKIREQY